MECPLCGSTDVADELMFGRENRDDIEYTCDECGHVWSNLPSPVLVVRWTRKNLLNDGWEQYDTGGNCAAFVKHFDKKTYVMLTDDGGLQLPKYGRPMLFGLYRDGVQIGTAMRVTILKTVDQINLIAEHMFASKGQTE